MFIPVTENLYLAFTYFEIIFHFHDYFILIKLECSVDYWEGQLGLYQPKVASSQVTKRQALSCSVVSLSPSHRPISQILPLHFLSPEEPRLLPSHLLIEKTHRFSSSFLLLFWDIYFFMESNTSWVQVKMYRNLLNLFHQWNGVS